MPAVGTTDGTADAADATGETPQPSTTAGTTAEPAPPTGATSGASGPAGATPASTTPASTTGRSPAGGASRGTPAPSALVGGAERNPDRPIRGPGAAQIPVTERLGLMQIGRLVMIVVVGGAAVIDAVTFEVERPLVIVAAMAFGVVSTLLELVRWRTRSRGVALLTLGAVLDVAFLTTVVVTSGGLRSPFLVLCYLLVVVRTLLVSYRSGLELAVLFALAFPTARRIAEAVLTAHQPISDADAVAASLLFLVFAAVTATCSAFNERALRDARLLAAALTDLAFIVETEADVRAICASAARHLRLTLGAPRVLVLWPVEEGLTGAVSSDIDEEKVELRSGPSTTTQAVLGDRPFGPTALVDAVAGTPGPTLDLLLPNAENLIVVPIGSDPTDCGWLVTEVRGRRARVATTRVDTIERSAAYLDLALRNTALLNTVEQLAARDALTGLANRRSFDKALEREVSRSRRSGRPLTLVFLDIDHFKQVNDTHGHGRGDEVLRRVAEALRFHARTADFVARVGGEEFIVLLPDTAPSDAVALADRIRVAAGEFVGASGRCPEVTMSAGVATYPDHAHDGLQLMQVADAALYEAKRSGRNHTTGVTGPPPPRDETTERRTRALADRRVEDRRVRTEPA